jgi:hypothetical protein
VKLSVRASKVIGAICFVAALGLIFWHSFAAEGLVGPALFGDASPLIGGGLLGLSMYLYIYYPRSVRATEEWTQRAPKPRHRPSGGDGDAPLIDPHAPGADDIARR